MPSALIQWLIVLGGLVVLGGCATPAGPLATLPMGSPEAAQDNLEGIKDYNNGRWEEARKHFESAIQADPNLPEAHFNLALVLHKLGKHEEAKQHFKTAGELAPKDEVIVESSIYRNHLGLSSTLERHMSGGYRY